ncbi:response regulator [Paremcibacter congregatus]|uniref:Response regulator n=1 Tax=Paremcibacter congregatus TaxID=2043170 RepID=A0A2G4YPW6_9PROT|nr:response regulator [Paremcibacter congregatus]PHZ84371.1 response regulator [Paremcibacter congregatus]QDE28590.1 response regulator [Paremcibacter congregatus]|tara:strand:- start:466 stop:840 length:375 start_codon:yes stop_codon:yes gene_type:complete
MARILIAEDELAVRTFVSRALELRGHSIVAVEDGGAAARALTLEEFDLLLTDIVMPVMDGIALALQAAAEHPDMPILMMTGYSHERQRAHNLESLIHDVISKPFSLDDLCDMVEKALKKGEKRA